MMYQEPRYKFDLFVSYHNHDLKEVEDIVYLLEHVGVRTWFDRTRITYEKLPSAIKNGIDQSRFFAFFLSRNAETSQWLEYEAQYFLKSRGNEESLPFILVKLSEGKPPPSIAHLATRVVHYFDFEKSFVDGFTGLARIFISNSAGLIKYYPSRSQVPPDVWDIFYAKAKREIRLMGHSMAPAFMDGRDKKLVLPVLRDRGVKMRIVLLTPNTPKLQQLQEVQMGLDKGVDLRRKTMKTIENIRQVKRALGDAGNESKLQVRVTDRIMYSQVSVFDSAAFVTSYSSREESGNNSPTFLVHQTGVEKGELFTFYNEEFERYWERGIHPDEERRKTEYDDSTRILQYKHQVSKIEKWIFRRGKSLPPPAMLIIYPTYQCSRVNKKGEEQFLCENCAYREKRSNQHLEFDVLSSILRQAVSELDIRNIEFSGGGEPLQYHDLKSLLRLLKEIKDENKKIRFGLLTNGLHLNDTLVPLIAPIFSYIRFTYAEGIQADGEAEEDFIANLQNLLRHAKNSGRPRIGLKILLSKQNAGNLVYKLLNLKRKLERDFQKLDHIRIKAMRSPKSSEFEPNDDDSLIFRNEFYDYLFTYQENWPKDIQVDVDLAYVTPDFKCRLSPLIAVVDPTGSLLACCNYLEDYQSLKIGNLRSERFKDSWGSERHRSVVKGINSQTVCNAQKGCPCRFVRYHNVLEESDQLGNLYAPDTINGFL